MLTRHYPQLIDSGLASDWSDSLCDFDGMRNDSAFRNDFADNLRRHSAYVGVLGERQVENLEALAAALSPSLSGEAAGVPAGTRASSPAADSRSEP